MERSAVYARVSRDRGDTTSVEEQLAECEREAKRRGWELTDRYEDKNKSASKPGTIRPEYQRLLEDVAAGRVTRLMVYMTDRLYRQPRELEDLIDLAEKRPMEIATVRSGDLDLGTPEGRAFARNAATWNKLEVEKLSERSGRGRAALKANGGWLGGGAVPYGYERVKDEKGKVREHRVVKAEAAVVKEAVRRVLAGDSMNAITRDLNARGINPRNGDRWLSSRLRATLTSPFHAGLHADGTTGDWPAIITADERALLLARLPRRAGERTDRRYALSGIAVCSECGTKLLGSDGAYRCMDRNGGCGKIRVASHLADAYVKEQVLDTVPEPEPRPDVEQAEDSLVDELHGVEAKLHKLREEYATGDILRDDFTVGRDALLRRQDDLERRIREEAPRPRIKFSELLEDPAPIELNEWIGEHVERVVVRPALRRGRGAEKDVPKRVEVVWR